MPYITEKQRDNLDMSSIGQLNFLITREIHNYIYLHGLNYSTLNAVIGVLSCAQMELYRKVAAPYEDKKLKENGSVSELDDG